MLLTYFARRILSLFALVLILAAFAFLFSPQVRTAFTTQSGESSIGQLESDAELTSPGQPARAPASEDEAREPADND